MWYAGGSPKLTAGDLGLERSQGSNGMHWDAVAQRVQLRQFAELHGHKRRTAAVLEHAESWRGSVEDNDGASRHCEPGHELGRLRAHSHQSSGHHASHHCRARVHLGDVLLNAPATGPREGAILVGRLLPSRGG